MQEMAHEGTAEMEAAHGCGQSGAAVTMAAPKSCARALPAARRRAAVRCVVEDSIVTSVGVGDTGGHTGADGVLASQLWDGEGRETAI